MWDPAQLALPHDFAGEVRIFPLPNFVLFPAAVAPLHIFEPRYCEMLEATLASDQLIAMALLQPGWESDYDGRPSIYPVTCIGKVISHAALEDGKHNILLRGLQRASVIRELPPDQPYRVSEVLTLEDQYPPSSEAERSQLEADLLRALERCVPDSPAASDQLESLVSGDLPLGVLADLLAAALDVDVAFKQQLLSQCDVNARVAQLLARLGQSNDAEDFRDFPPPFSDN